MTSHEKWLKFYTDFDDEITKSSQGCIFWSSSESDHDDNISESPVRKRRLSIGSSSSGRSEISKNEIVRSPTLNSNWKKESPVLSCKLRLDMSPILVNKFKRHRRKVETKLDVMPLYCTPDLFNSQPSQIIEDEVPDASQKSCKVELDVSNATQIEATQSSVVIEPVFSQNASVVAEHGSDNSNALTDSFNSGSSYHVPRKKKRYKKGSLAKKVYNMIQSQSFRCTVWQIYKNNSTNNDDTSIKCSVTENWKDYGTSVLECNVIGSREGTERTILICLSPMINISLEVGSICEFFKPYIEKTIFYNNQEVTCYINVIKIQLIVDT